MADFFTRLVFDVQQKRKQKNDIKQIKGGRTLIDDYMAEQKAIKEMTSPSSKPTATNLQSRAVSMGAQTNRYTGNSQNLSGQFRGGYNEQDGKRSSNLVNGHFKKPF